MPLGVSWCFNVACVQITSERHLNSLCALYCLISPNDVCREGVYLINEMGDYLNTWLTNWKMASYMYSVNSVIRGHLYLCCHASHWFHVSTSAPPTVPRPYMGDYLRWAFIDKERTFSSTNSIQTKKQLYLSLARSQLSYGSQLWRPMLLKDILSLEKIRRGPQSLSLLKSHLLWDL